MRPFDIITFDCYGTLIDWEAGITKAFQDAAAADGVSLDSAAVLRALFDTRSASEAPEYRSYRDILTDPPAALLITAQEVRSYKPAPGHFATARNRIAPRPWLHAAQSYLHDVTPAVAHNIPSG